MKDVLPPLDRFDYEKLEASILSDGVREPIVVNEHGIIIDGENRKEISERLGLPCPEREVSGLTVLEMRDLCIILNAARRQLTVEQRRQVWQSHRAEVKHLLLEQPTRSDRSIADQLGVHHTTVAKDREELESNGELAILERRGRGEPVEKEPAAINVADHRNEVYFELSLGYPCESDDIRKRGDDPYPQESDRLTWTSGRQYLVASAPRDAAEAGALVNEVAQRVRRELYARPLKTMVRTLA